MNELQLDDEKSVEIVTVYDIANSRMKSLLSFVEHFRRRKKNVNVSCFVMDSDSSFYTWYVRLRNRTEYYTEKDKQVDMFVSGFDSATRRALKKWQKSCIEREQELFDVVFEGFHKISDLIADYVENTSELCETWRYMQEDHDRVFASFTEHIQRRGIDMQTSWVFNPSEISVTWLRNLHAEAQSHDFIFNEWLNRIMMSVRSPHSIVCPVGL